VVASWMAAEHETRNEIKQLRLKQRSARVVRLENATDYVFRSNESELLRETNDFSELAETA
jgi:hypothetical protein